MTERLCIVTRQAVAPEQRVRFVIDPEGGLAPDLAEKLPGRGAYVTADPELLRQAVNRRHFRRHLGEDLHVPVDGDKLCAQVEALLQARFIQQLGLARRANLAVIGSCRLPLAKPPKPSLTSWDLKKAMNSRCNGALRPAQMMVRERQPEPVITGQMCKR